AGCPSSRVAYKAALGAVSHTAFQPPAPRHQLNTTLTELKHRTCINRLSSPGPSGRRKPEHLLQAWATRFGGTTTVQSPVGPRLRSLLPYASLAVPGQPRA